MNDSTEYIKIEIAPDIVAAGAKAFDKWLEEQSGEGWFVSSPPQGAVPSLILANASSVRAPLSSIQAIISEHKS
jgi:hypothetical protein